MAAPSPARVLVVDDEAGIRKTLRQILDDEGYSVAEADSAGAARTELSERTFDAVLLDVWLPDGEGTALLEEIRGKGDDTPVVMISGHGTIETAVRAVRSGAQDFLEKPLSLERVLLATARAVEHGRLHRRVLEYEARLGATSDLVGDSAPMKALRETISKAARGKGRVLITGENGSGKELVARALHAGSERAGAPFVEVNCAAIPEELIESELFGHVRGAFTGALADRKGRFELADTGTIFLDEIGDMSPRTQAKVLRVLEEPRFTRVGGTREIDVDVRMIAATNRDLAAKVRDGSFREDLFFRLSVIPIKVPPLRERLSDLPALVASFCARLAAENRTKPRIFTEGALARLARHSWPGNVRELRNFVERVHILAAGEVIDEAALRPFEQELGGGTPAPAPPTEEAFPGWSEAPTLREARDEWERRFILRAIEEQDGNVARAAERLGIEKSGLYRKLRSWGWTG